MKLEKQNVLMFSRTMGLGGTEGVVLQLCRILKPLVNRIVVCSCGGVNTEKLQEMGIPHYTIADIEQKSPATVLGVLRDVRRIIREEQITVIHTHHRMAAFYTRLLSFGGDFTAVNTSHNTFTDKRVLTRFALQKSNLIACGQQVKENLCQVYGLDPQGITVIHNAAEAYSEAFVPDPQLSRLREDGYALIGNVGRLSEQKGMEYFLQAVPAVKQAGFKAKFVVIGEGEDRKKLAALVDSLQIRDDVLFLGFRSDIRNVMHQMDFLVLSSLWEGLPLTPIEAFSVGRTVIGTAVDGTPEVITHEQDGLLVPPRDPDAIAQGILRLLQDPQLRKRLEEQALETFQSRFSFDRYAQKVTEFYIQL